MMTIGMDKNMFTCDKSSTNFHLTSLFETGFNALQSKAATDTSHDAIIGINPSGWNWSKVVKRRADTQPYTLRHYNKIFAYGFPYSEHSAFHELVEFVSYIQPKTIVPTVAGKTKDAVQKQLVPFHKYIDLTEDKSTIIGFFGKTNSAPGSLNNLNESTNKKKAKEKTKSTQKSLFDFVKK